MNVFIGVGTLGKDPELRTTQNGVSVATFSLALRRSHKDANGEYGTD